MNNARDVLKGGDSSLLVKIGNGFGVFNGRPEAVLLEWNPMVEGAQDPEQTKKKKKSDCVKQLVSYLLD